MVSRVTVNATDVFVTSEQIRHVNKLHIHSAEDLIDLQGVKL